MTCRVGDLVHVVDDDIEGRVYTVANTEITIETADGFLMTFDADELVKVEENSQTLLEDIEVDLSEIRKQKEYSAKRKKNPVRKKEKIIPPMEVDLHIDKLVPSVRGMSNHDMLTKQLDTARGQLEFAIRKRIQRIVFIHGVGEGVLKAELDYLFSRYNNVRYYDANYQKYGLGATEVYILQNSPIN